MKTALAGILLLFTALVCPAHADSTNGPAVTHIALDLRDGSRVVGVFDGKKLALDSASVGELKMPVERIRKIEWPTDKDLAKLQATNGDQFQVELRLAELPVSTSFGEIKVPVGKIRKLQFWTGTGETIRLPGLVALWSGEGNGNDSAGTNHATLAGNAAFVQGKVGQAFGFDGMNSCVKIPQTPNLNLADQVTVSFWMKADTDNPMTTFQGLVTSDFYVVEISSGYGGRMGVNFAISTTANQPMGWNGQRMGITTAANFTHISDGNSGGAPVTPGEWHFIVGTYDGTKLQLYVDGRPWGNPVRKIGTIAPMLPNSFVAIGSEDGRTTCPDCVANRYFKGSIDEAAIYNRALSADEVRQLFDAGNLDSH